jgi:hypothetical protein
MESLGGPDAAFRSRTTAVVSSIVLTTRSQTDHIDSLSDAAALPTPPFEIGALQPW